jgi:NADH:ubiquinone oxidoreductase subunit 5 (subunit L)/multisubunit Na+/H+ antiporter MnhA subunit
MIGRLIGHRGSAVISISCLFVAMISSACIWYEVIFSMSEVYVDLFGSWFTVGSFNVNWTMYIDLYTAHMLLTVTGVSCAVHCYAVVYMRSDPHLNLFMSYLSLFTFFMLVLVCSDNCLTMLVGWEGSSNCLIDSN